MDNKFDIKYFLPNKKKEKGIVFIALILLALGALLIFKLFSNISLPKASNPTNIPSSNKKQNLKQNKIKVSSQSSDLEKKDINLILGEDTLIITLVKESADSIWNFASSYDHNVVELTDIKFKDAKQNVSLSAPTEEWTFKTVKTGSTNINLSLRDGQLKTVKTEVFTIKVR